MKFGTEQQIMNLMTVTPSKIKILQIQDNGWPPYLKSFVVHNSAAGLSDVSEVVCEDAAFRKISAIGQIPAFYRTYFLFFL